MLVMKRLFYFLFVLALLAQPFFSPAVSFAESRAASEQFVLDSAIVSRLDSIVVSSDRAGVKTPVPYTCIGRSEIKNAAASHSLPMVLGFQPSVVATTEGGLGLGYSSISVRGSDATRINVTLNGIAVNNSESQSVFWVDVPSMGGFLQSIQLQRGVGTSINGPGAFGATMNMRTIAPSDKPYGNAEFSFGSYQTYMTSVAAGTGETKAGFSFDVKYAHSTTDGYIRNAKAKLNSLFISAGWNKNDRNSLKLIYIYGDQATGITWEGCPPERYEENRRYNVTGEYYDKAGNVHYYDNETDNYKQHNAQLHYVHKFTDNLVLDATIHYTRGDGYYENYKADAKFSKYGLENQVIDGITYKKSDIIIRQYMYNDYYAVSSNLDYRKNKLHATAGAAYSYYNGDHTGKVKWSMYDVSVPSDFQWYKNTGKKGDLSFFARAEYDIYKNLTVFADLQYRHVSYRMSGDDKDFVDLKNNADYDFFNPKAGLTYTIDKRSKAYFSVAIGHREPSRSDLKESIKAGKADEIKSERMVDYELGYNFANEKFTGGVNIYFMEYKNQLVATGKLTATGYTIQENIPDSYRRGIELYAGYRILKNLRADANLTLSKNKLKNYTLYTDTYDNSNDWNPVEQTAIFLKKSNLTLSPQIIGMGMLTYVIPCKSDADRTFAPSISLNAKYVGKQYMDNSSMDIAKVPAYFTMGLDIQKSFRIKGSSTMQLSLCIDNLLNRKYYSYGWIYRAMFKDGSDDYVEKGVYAQATTNFIAKVAFNF